MSLIFSGKHMLVIPIINSFGLTMERLKSSIERLFLKFPFFIIHDKNRKEAFVSKNKSKERSEEINLSANVLWILIT